jgi:hypothetical protein
MLLLNSIVLFSYHALFLNGIFFVSYLLESNVLLAQLLQSLYFAVRVTFAPFFIDSLSPYVVNDFGTMALAYFLHDSWIYLKFAELKMRKVMLLHHFVAINLVIAHMSGIFPVKMGTTLLLMFETTNVTLYMLLLFKELGRKAVGDMLVYPFVFTYVPIRGFCIPYYSIKYWPIINDMSRYSGYYCIALFIFMNAFNIFFAVKVCIRFLQKLVASTSFADDDEED